ncbi:glycosyltransferase family 2 protein [Novosphingobium colocasiae]|uniref:Succinoglycan biosynthesis protein exoa n=1 Tax=Novosphingobium colocasiae TaxID=1256513 RepID=A0A918PFG9_9SPHN|nr:glycosyltransferase family 2 protein [Novosphingobium colocasiae]GGZ05877.1 succinoglycan biosynthesis protein exoa [Novosphingobium colocasiae]
MREDVLVVIPCLNEEAHLPRLLDGLLRHARGETIVVADGGSTDRSRRIVADLARRSSRLHLLDNPAKLQSAAVNLAARRFGAGARWLVRIDAHCDYPDDYVGALLAAAMARRATSVVVPMVSVGRGCFQRAAAAAQNSVLGTGGSPHRHLGRGQWVDHGHHALFDMARYLAVGGYDEHFTANEDAELDRRLAATGARIWLEPACAITYYPRRSPLALFRQYRHYGIGRARNLRRHRVPLRLRQMLPVGVVPAVAAAVLGAALVPWLRPAAVLAAPGLIWLALVLVGGVALGMKQGDRCACASGVAAAIMHFGWSWGFLREAIARPPLPLPPARLLPEGCEPVSPQAAFAAASGGPVPAPAR